MMNEDLRAWFGKGPKGGAGGGGWDRYNTKGERVGKCARDDKDGDGKGDGPKPKCLSKEKAASMSKSERGASVRRKRAKDSNPDRKGAAIHVNTKKKTNEEVILEKEGYRTVEVPVNGEISDKAVTGKIVGFTAGAAISFATMGHAGTELMAAPFSGSSKKLKPNPVNVKLSPPNTVIIRTGVK